MRLGYGSTVLAFLCLRGFAKLVAEILVALTKNALSSRGFAKVVAEILVALTKNALSSGPKGRLGHGRARGALARLPRGIQSWGPL